MKSGKYQFDQITYTELIANARKIREREFFWLSSLSYDKLINYTTQSINNITLSRPTSDLSQIIKISSLIYTLIKLRQDHFPRLISILNNLKADKNEQVGIFVSFVYSKVLKRAQREFLQQKLENCLLKLKSASNVLQTAYFLFFLAKHSPNSILLSITHFINANTKVIMHKREDVRFVGYETLKIYLQILNNNGSGNSQHPTFPLYIFAQQNLQKSYHEQHGAFLIFMALLEFSPHSIDDRASELMRFFYNLLPKCPPGLRQLILKNFVLLSQLDMETFKNNYLDIVASALINDNNQLTANRITSSSLYSLIHFIPECSANYTAKVLTIIQNLLTKALEAPLDEGFLILEEILTHYPEIVQNNMNELAQILIHSKICTKFIEVIPKIFFRFPIIWNLYRKAFIKNLVKNPKEFETVSVLNLIAISPPLESPEVLSFLITSLSTKDPDVRCCAPKALLAHIPYDDEEYVFETIHRLITIALSDPEPLVREQILKSFNSKCYKYLTIDQILKCLSSLVKDEKISVSNAAIELLGNISKLSPFFCLPQLRSLLLDALVMLDSTCPLRRKEEIARSFLTIINAAEEILPIYCPTLCLIALRQLSFTPLCELTYFDQSYLHNINLNITKAIGIIADRDGSLIGPHVPQFTNFFIWFLQQHGPKQLKIAVVKTLYKLIAWESRIKQIDVGPIFSALTTVASIWNSRKLNVAVLKLIGLIGAVDQLTYTSDNTTKLDNTIRPSSPAYPMSCACKTLISVLSDDFLVVHHSDAIRSLVNIFCYDTTATVSFFNEFMLIFLDQIRKQKTSEYIILLNKLIGEAPREWVMHYTNELITLVKELWKSSLLSYTLDLIPTLAYVFADHFSFFLLECITFLLDCLFSYRSSVPEICHKVFVSLVSLQNISNDYFFLVYPELINAITMPTTLFAVRIDALITLRVLVQKSFSFSFSALAIRCIIHCIQSGDSRIQYHAMMILYSLMVKSGEMFSFYAEQIVLTLQKENLLTLHFLEILQSKSTNLSDFPFIDTDDHLTFVPKSKPEETKSTENQTESESSNNNSNDNDNENNNNNDNSSEENTSNTNEENSSKTKSSKNEEDTNNSKSNKTEEDNKSKTKNDDKSHKNNDDNSKSNDSKNSRNNEDENNATRLNSLGKNLKITLSVNEKEIRRILYFQEEETPWNWKEWYKSIVKTLLENSMSISLVSCTFLCDVLFTTAENLLNPAFLSIWVNLTSETQLIISASLTRSLLSDALPNTIRTSFVNLFEFMERSENPLPISRQVLCQASEKCSQYAKAFYFVHRWFEEDHHNIEAIETLIRLSNALGLKKTIIGISAHLSQEIDVVSNPQWSEQLGQWSKAMESYKKMPLSSSSLEGIMRCLKHLQRWDEIIEMLPVLENLLTMKTPASQQQQQQTSTTNQQSNDVESKGHLNSSMIYKLQIPFSTKKNIASIIATALFHRQQWSKLPLVLDFINHDRVRVLIITALYQISQNKREEALQTVSQGFNLLAQNACGAFKHDKAGVYPLLVKAQQLQEITEIANQTQSLDVWEKRLSLCRQSYDVYHQILSVHLTVYPISEAVMLKDGLKMLKLALRSKNFQLFDASLHFLFPEQSTWPTEVSFIHAKGMWARGMQREAFVEAKEILKRNRIDDKNLKAKIFFCCGQWIISMTPPSKVNDVIKNAVKYLEQSIRQGTHYYHAWHRWAWASSVIYYNDKSNVDSAFNAINGFLECVRLKNDQSLSELLQMISLFFTADLSAERFASVAAHIANLSDSVLLKIIPQLFTQLSNDGNRSSSFASNIAKKLLPDHFHVLLYPLILIARHDQENNEQKTIEKVIHSSSDQLISTENAVDENNNNYNEEEFDDVEEENNDFPSNSNSNLNASESSNRNLAKEILQHFEEENPVAVQQSQIVSDGLLLCSSSPLEIYSDVIVKTVRYIQKQKLKKAQQNLSQCLHFNQSLIKSSRMKVTEDDNQISESEVSSSFSFILSNSPLASSQQIINLNKELVLVHSQLNSIIKKITETKIALSNGVDTENPEVGRSYISEMQYHSLYSEISKRTHQLMKKLQSLYSTIQKSNLSSRTVSMHAVAPMLAQLRNSILAVPGTYSIDEPVINIFQFDPTLDIFNSKQRPRLLAVYGTDGVCHKSLLKGREDLRMDQRVMQFFELINQHITNDFSNDSRSMHITTYSITPLSTCAGLIQFVDGTDTLYSLISEYRTNHGVHIFAEQESMEEFSVKNIDTLTPVQRLEALKIASNENKDTDLRELMWLNSPSCREWVNRSTQFTQSSALMSIIGYIIGLGDRHPSNLMIHRTTGSIVHIDFGDCFEVGKKRVKFPEVVPFRLTRLMISAFGPTGIEGEFRLTCEETVKLVRSHKESIMAVLDIFLQEPIKGIIDDDFVDDDDEDVVDENEENNNNNISLIEFNISMVFDEDEKNNKRKKENGSIEDSLNRIMQKIIGNDFDPKVELSIEEQVDALISDATYMYNLAYLYHGWTPLW